MRSDGDGDQSNRLSQLLERGAPPTFQDIEYFASCALHGKYLLQIPGGSMRVRRDPALTNQVYFRPDSNKTRQLCQLVTKIKIGK